MERVTFGGLTVTRARTAMEVRDDNLREQQQAAERWGDSRLERQDVIAAERMRNAMARDVLDNMVVANLPLRPFDLDGLDIRPGRIWRVGRGQNVAGIARARELLERNLNESQSIDFRANGYFHVHGQDDRAYRIEAMPSYNVLCGSFRYCVQFEDPDIPIYDLMLAQKLLIEHDINHFMRVAHRDRAGSGRWHAHPYA